MIHVTSCEYLDKELIVPPFSHYWQAPMEYDDNDATRFLNVAAVSLDVNRLPEVNRSKIIFFIDKIKSEQPDVRLILFPETTLGYYFLSSDPYEYQKSIAETIPGITTDLISEKAIEHQIYISFGMAEKSGENLYNSQVLIGPDGTILSVHHKIFFTPQDRKSGFTAGNNITLNKIDGIKVATIICRDINSLNVNNQIHKSGAELVLVVVADVTNIIENLLPHKFSHTWLLGANRVGNEDGLYYNGLLFLTTPGGENRVRVSGKEGYIYGVVKCR